MTTPDNSTVRKTFKAAAPNEAGEFEAVIVTYGVVDSDGDIVEAGAFEEGQRVVIDGAFAHLEAPVPVGVGTFASKESEGRISGKFLATQDGQDTRTILAATDDIMEWSYVAKITDYVYADSGVRVLKGLDLRVAGPVLRGAGLNTRTLSVKSEKPEPEPTPAEEPTPFPVPAEPVAPRVLRGWNDQPLT